nr:HEPN domain-containing protein [Pedobacter kyonggii]
MQGHLNQALHNHNFTDECCKNYPDKYFDWKVTATFYTALHLIRAFCEGRGVDPGRNHSTIKQALNPRGTQLTPFKPHAYRAYTRLQDYSEIARYDTFLNAEVENEIQRDNFKECQKLLEELKGYLKGEGVNIDQSEAA